MDLFGLKISEKIYMPIIIILVSLIVYAILNIILGSKITINKNLSKHEKRSRETVLLLINNMIKVAIIVIAAFGILQVFGVNTSALVAGATAISLVVGLAFQDILKDLLVGAAIILESQYAIGEVVSINGFKGEVISLNLRSTRLKSMSGEVRIIANRNISEVTNYSLGNVIVKVLVSISYETDIKKAEKVLGETIEKLNSNIEELNTPITIAGLDSLSSSSVDYLLTAGASAKNEYIIKRKILREVKLAFDNNNIKIPYPQLEVHYDK